MFSANLLAISEECWYLIRGHFFNDNKTAKIPWHERSNASISHDPPYKYYKKKNRREQIIKIIYVAETNH